MWSNVNLGDESNDAIHVKCYLNKLWQTLFGERCDDIGGELVVAVRRRRRRLMTTPAYVRQQIARQLFIQWQNMRDPKMNGLHVVAFNAFATYEILLSWSTLFAIYTSSIWSTFLRIRYVNMALQIFRLSVPVAEHTQCLQKFMQNHSPITLNRSMLHRLAVACSIVGIQLKVQNFSCFSVVLHFVMLVRFAGWRGAGANTLHTITSTCKWQNCRCCRATWSGSCNRQSTIDISDIF